MLMQQLMVALALTSGFPTGDPELNIQGQRSAAIYLVNTPVTCSINYSIIPDKEIGFLREAVRRYAISEQLCDEREHFYLLNKDDEFQPDVLAVRRRSELLRDAPKIEEGYWLPKRTHISENIKFNRAHKKYLEARLAIEPDRAKILNACIAENEELYKIWDLARDVKCEFYYLPVRREALKKLKCRLSEWQTENGQNYWEARMLPPNVPVWRFRTIE